MRVICVVVPQFYVQGAETSSIVGGSPGGWEEILSCLAGITLRVETGAAGVAFLDAVRLPSAYGDEAGLCFAAVRLIGEKFGLRATAGAGGSRFVASEAAALAAPHVLVVPPGGEKKFLSPLPVERLPVPVKVRERLRFLGLGTLGQVRAIPLAALSSQFGALGKTLWELVRGIEHTGRIPGFLRVSEMEEDMVLETPACSREQAGAAVMALLHALCRDLEEAGMACRAMKLTLCLRNEERREKDFIFHAPEARKEYMARRVMSWMSGMELPSPVYTMAVRASALSVQRGVQETLFTRRRGFSGELGDMGGFLKAKYGCMPLVRVRESDANALLPDERFVFAESS